MSITFSIMQRHEDGTLRFAYRCDCSQRWCDACDKAFDNGETSPEMFTCENCTDVEVNMANANALEWMQWVGIAVEYSGEINASDLAAKCRRRLWNEARNYDPALDHHEINEPGRVRVIIAGRDRGYLRNRTEAMLKVCEKAGDRMISWG